MTTQYSAPAPATSVKGWKTATAALGAALAASLGLTAFVATNRPEPVAVAGPETTVTATQTAEPLVERVTVTPEVCLEALDDADQMRDALTSVLETFGEHIDSDKDFALSGYTDMAEYNDTIDEMNGDLGAIVDNYTNNNYTTLADACRALEGNY